MWEEDTMKTIFDRTSLGKIEVKNRIVAATTWHDLAGAEGHITPELTDVYRE